MQNHLTIFRNDPLENVYTFKRVILKLPFSHNMRIIEQFKATQNLPVVWVK